MGRSKHHNNPNRTVTPRKSPSKSPQQSALKSQNHQPANPTQFSSPEQVLALQRQIGNKSVSRLLANGEAGIVQLEDDGVWDPMEAVLARGENQEEEENKVHEFDKATYDEKSPRAKHLAERLGIIMNADYDAMIQDEKGLKAIDVTAKVDRYLNAAFSHDERMYDDYIGKENLPIVLEQIKKVPGLYEKLALLLAMEPFHARLIGAFLDIPPLKGFDYKIYTKTASAGADDVAGVGVSATKVELTCFQDGDELWKQEYYMGAIGVTAGADIDATLTEASGTFETLVFWGPGDFVGQMRMGSASAGAFGHGYSFGVGTFMGDGGKGSLTIDMSGEIQSSGELGAGAFIGYLTTVGEGSRSRGPKTKTLDYEPKIKVTEEIDDELVITFPEKSDKAGGSFKDKFLAFLAKALTAERLHVTIRGSSTLSKSYNVKLMQKRIKSTRKMVEQVVKERKIDPERVHIEEIEVVNDGEPGRWKDPPRDRATKVHLKGTITVRSPDDAT